jgi:F0F1-type ATP synthase membrane subunit b/b'
MAKQNVIQCNSPQHHEFLDFLDKHSLSLDQAHLYLQRYLRHSEQSRANSKRYRTDPVKAAKRRAYSIQRSKDVKAALEVYRQVSKDKK